MQSILTSVSLGRTHGYLFRLLFDPEDGVNMCDSKTSIDFHRSALRYILEDNILHSHRCQNLRFK
jgi:hypothetical protein